MTTYDNKGNLAWTGTKETHDHKIECPHCKQKFPYRCNELYPELPYRKYIRDRDRGFPRGYEGFIVSDIDLCTRMFGINGRDRFGTFKLMELKKGSAEWNVGQKYLFYILDKLLWHGDITLRKSKLSTTNRYEGFYEIWCSTYDWYDPLCKWKINDIEVNRDQLKAFLLNDIGGFPSEIHSKWYKTEFVPLT